MKKLKIIIEGMHCTSCAGNVERSVKKIPGVKSISVSFLTRKGTVEAEDSVTDAQLTEAVKKTGYKLVGVERS